MPGPGRGPIVPLGFALLCIALVTPGLPGCRSEEPGPSPVVEATRESDRLRRRPVPKRPPILLADLPLADSSASPDSSTATPTKVIGSVALIPYSRLATTRLRPAAAASPTMAPTATSTAA